MESNSEPRYVISIAARMIGIETHTLRYYERLGLIQPCRSGGNIRLYSEDDINQLRYIKTLVNDLGVNLAGVEVVLKLLQRMEEMQLRVGEMEDKIKRLTQANIEAIEWKEE